MAQGVTEITSAQYAFLKNGRLSSDSFDRTATAPLLNIPADLYDAFENEDGDAETPPALGSESDGVLPTILVVASVVFVLILILVCILIFVRKRKSV